MTYSTLILKLHGCCIQMVYLDLVLNVFTIGGMSFVCIYIFSYIFPEYLKI